VWWLQWSYDDNGGTRRWSSTAERGLRGRDGEAISPGRFDLFIREFCVSLFEAECY